LLKTEILLLCKEGRQLASWCVFDSVDVRKDAIREGRVMVVLLGNVMGKCYEEILWRNVTGKCYGGILWVNVMENDV
jgi:hypothetical protein